jgi:hypothetical protein
MPNIKYSNGLLHLVWSEKNKPLYHDLFHSQSSDGGRSWSQPNMVFINSAFRNVAYSTLATNGDTLFVACKIDDLIQFRGFIFFKSFDAGQTWQDSIMIDQGEDLGIFQYPHLLYSRGILQFVYPLLTGNDSIAIEVYLKRSTDLGLHWSDREFLSPVDTFPRWVDSQIPSAIVDSSGRTLVMWDDAANSDSCGSSIFYRVSLDNGEMWQPYGSITDAQLGGSLACLIVGDRFIIGWNDFRFLDCSYIKEAYSFSTDYGQSWQLPQYISGRDPIDDSHPALTYTIQGADTIIHYFFDRDEHLYYMRDHNFVGINDSYVPNRPNEIGLSAYPNPFNFSTIISFSNIKDDEIRIFDIKGSLVRILTPEQKGNGSIIWDATDDGGQKVTSGIYFARATSQNNSSVVKLIYLK